jgi:hypothetical protein
LEDIDIVNEIGFFQEQGLRVSLKTLSVGHETSMATVLRRLGELRRLGVVLARESSRDRRTVELALAPDVLRVFRRYDRLEAKLWRR